MTEQRLEGGGAGVVRGWRGVLTAPPACSHAVSPSPQCTASPMNALVVLSTGPGDGRQPNTVGMSPLFSSTMFAEENAPNEQPALLNATQGSGRSAPVAPSAAGTVGEYTIDGSVRLSTGPSCVVDHRRVPVHERRVRFGGPVRLCSSCRCCSRAGRDGRRRGRSRSPGCPRRCGRSAACACWTSRPVALQE